MSDLHTDHPANMEWLKSLPTPNPPEDVLIIAGDVASALHVLEATLRECLARFAKVFFVPGNHEAWVAADAPQRYIGASEPKPDSLTKLARVRELCETLGVQTTPQLLGSVWVVPLAAWYDLSLDLVPSGRPPQWMSDLLRPFRGGDDAADADADGAGGRWQLPSSFATLVQDFDSFGWSDFAMCKWPEELESALDTFTGKYPSGVAQRLLAANEPLVRDVHAALCAGRGAGVLSFSHFLPCRQTLPDWMDPHADAFDPSWLGHAAAGKAAKFSRVAGSAQLDRQLRALTAGLPEGRTVKHVHAFGHSHRPKDFELRGVRYVHHPVAYGEERRTRRVPPTPCFKLIWDASGPVPSERILRFWEEHGGSVG